MVSHRMLLQNASHNLYKVEPEVILNIIRISKNIKEKSHQNQSKSIKIRCKIDKRSLMGAILAQDRLEHRFYMIWGRFEVPFWRSEMVKNSISKSSHFHASPEILFSTIGDPKSFKIRFQNNPRNAAFSGVGQDLKIVFSPRRELSFRGLERSGIACFSELFS